MSPKLSTVSKNNTSLDCSNEQPRITLKINKQNIMRVTQYSVTALIMKSLSVNVLCCFTLSPPNINYIVNTSEKEAQKKSQRTGLDIREFFLFYN